MTEAERTKPRGAYVDEAIELALESRWGEALATNQTLLEKFGPDEAVYNRIGKAQTELGNLQAAIESYGKALEMNPLNAIAAKNTRKIAVLLETSEKVATSTAVIDVDLFTEEPGKSVLTMLSTPKKSVTVSVAPGDAVELDPSDGKLEARTGRGVLIGEVDVKLAHRLIGFIETGNRYNAAVARVSDDGIEIMIREEFQSAENAKSPSFPVSRGGRGSDFRPYAKDSLLADRGIDAEPLDPDADEDDDDDSDTETIDTAMQTTEDFDADAGALSAPTDEEETVVADDDEEEEKDDDDSRPEDHY